MKRIALWSKYYRVNTLTNEVSEQKLDISFDQAMMFHFLNGVNAPNPRYPVPKTYVFAKDPDIIREEEE